MRFAKISRNAAIATAAAGMAALTLFMKPVKAEPAMLKGTDTAVVITSAQAEALFKKECPKLSQSLTGAARGRAMEIAARLMGKTYVYAREDDVKPLAGDAGAIGIGELNMQINRYSDLDASGRAELERKVLESGNAGLINYFRQAKGNAEQPGHVKMDSAQGQVIELEPIVIETKEGGNVPPVKAEDAQAQVEAMPAAVTPDLEVAKMGAMKDVAALKDSLQAAITECYARINMMEGAADSAEIARAIAGMADVMARGLPAGDGWGEYKLRHLKEYFAGACRARLGREE